MPDPLWAARSHQLSRREKFPAPRCARPLLKILLGLHLLCSASISSAFADIKRVFLGGELRAAEGYYMGHAVFDAQLRWESKLKGR